MSGTNCLLIFNYYLYIWVAYSLLFALYVLICKLLMCLHVSTCVCMCLHVFVVSVLMFTYIPIHVLLEFRACIHV